MLFKLQGDKGTVWYMDNETATIYDANHNPINVKTLPSAEPYLITWPSYFNRAYVNSRFDYDKKYNVQYTKCRNVKIQLGLHCNYHCIYCSQGPLSKEQARMTINIEELCTKIKKTKINWDTVRMIEFWGGEPLVYWKQIKKLVLFFEQEIGYKGHFHLTTNASLFTQKVFDFCDCRKFDLLFSHDGVNQKLFRCKDDWLDDPTIVNLVKLWHKRHKLNTRICMVYAPFGELNIWKSLDLFAEKIAPDIDVMFHSGLRCESSSKHLLAKYTPENCKLATEYMYQASIVTPDSKYYNMLAGNNQHATRDLFSLIHGRLVASYNSKCPTINRHTLSFDMNGRIITCHGNCANHQAIGTIDKVEDAYYQHFSSIHHSKRCSGCLYTNVCGGSCPLYGAEDNYIECKSTHWRVEALFQAAWFTIFNERPIRIEKCDP